MLASEPGDNGQERAALPPGESIAAAVSRIQRGPREDWLAELRADQAARWQGGQPVPVESYVRCWPELVANEEETLVVICGEVRLAASWGKRRRSQSIKPISQLATPLRLQFQLDQMLDSSLADEPAPSLSLLPQLGWMPETTDADERLCPSCGSNFRLVSNWREERNPDGAARTLGKYQLLDRVGVGSFGTVYKARDPELDRMVAIKLPRSGNWAVQEDIERFLREARSVARLTHPSIIPVYEIGRSEHTLYLVSEFVRGTTLAELLSLRRPVRAVRSIGGHYRRRPRLCPPDGSGAPRRQTGKHHAGRPRHAAIDGLRLGPVRHRRRDDDDRRPGSGDSGVHESRAGPRRVTQGGWSQRCIQPGRHLVPLVNGRVAVSRHHADAPPPSAAR